MPTAHIINGAHPYPHAKGTLNQAYADKAAAFLTGLGWTVERTNSADDWDVEDEVAKHQRADAQILQMPMNGMGWPWSLKRYLDAVYSAGMDGRLCARDGRSPERPKENYGGGGTLTGRHYMISITFNAPAEAFGDPSQFLFQGRTVDDLVWPQHMNYRFIGMVGLPTFSAHDVMKNPTIDDDFARFDAHLARHFNADGVVAV